MKSRIYVESSVISYAASRKSSNAKTAYRQEVTQLWWDKATDRFALESSAIVQFEIAAGDASAAQKRLTLFATLVCVPLHEEIASLSERLMLEGLVPRSEPEDASHIAQATLTQADYIATWNFAHMVGPQAKYRLVQSIERWGYKAPLLATPEEILEGLML
ncbi:hypothetical protein GALL_442490 [mine drainage metagenome]|uniref:PIN domain-containing protein n=1 Tax=mine drainage metagenome TaxID=410659 RepID=A0A1J5Q9E4_9ZZZZ